ncbi:hypothetical protein DK419_00960 [Methylobacterium terrae]|uniref:F5/8 type C domain-containing protein n=1 Tax=Methylobacterium terrae TaxID=2202827 RepID=A0A2U8WFS4_9HYPH|nr:hypothetical protein [Methylobacterium terrae]AWN45075.1 hypothetical protein DK419_00960 [Methylobacterium terrae]
MHTFRTLCAAALILAGSAARALDPGERPSTSRDPGTNFDKLGARSLRVPSADALTVGDKAISAILGTKAPLASPTFSGDVTVSGKVSAEAITGEGTGATVTPSDGRGKDTLGNLIGRTPVRFYPENFGQGASVGTGGDDVDAIARALNAAAAVRGTAVIRTALKSSTMLTVPSGATLQIEGGSLTFTADTNGVRIAESARMNGWGDINVGAGVAGFSKTAILIDGTGGITDALISGAIRVNNVSGARTGTGLGLVAAGLFANRVIYTRLELASISKFATGVQLKASGLAFVNSNYVKVGVIYDCIYHIVTDTSDFNFFTGAIQPEASAARALVVGGQGNQFELMVWDWHLAADKATAIEFMPGSRNNIVQSPVGPDLVTDRASASKRDANTVLDWRNIAPALRPLLPPSIRFPTWAGSQDDILVHADKRWTVTQTAGSPPTGGALANIFDLDIDSGAGWNATSAFPVAIEVDFGTTGPGYFFGMGANFDFGQVPPNVSFETFDGSTWTTQRTFTDNANGQVAYAIDGFLTGVRKVRMTMSGAPSGGAVNVSRMFAFGTLPDGGGAFRPTYTDRPLNIKMLTVAPPPTPGYGRIFNDINDGKWKVIEPSGIVRTFVTTP